MSFYNSMKSDAELPGETERAFATAFNEAVSIYGSDPKEDPDRSLATANSQAGYSSLTQRQGNVVAAIERYEKQAMEALTAFLAGSNNRKDRRVIAGRLHRARVELAELRGSVTG